MNLHSLSVETSQPIHANVQRLQAAGHLSDLRKAQTAGRLLRVGDTEPKGTEPDGTNPLLSQQPSWPFEPAYPSKRRPAVSALQTLWNQRTVHILQASRRRGWDVSTDTVVP